MNSTIFFCVIFFTGLIHCQQIIEIYQSDFNEGTYLISEPGYYRLMEDILFNPNNVANVGPTAYESGDVLPSQYSFMGGKYDPAAFGIGFFAAISIFTEDATLDLNGFTIAQAPEFALQQTFYSHIELADQPFIPNQGPHDFGDVITSATRVTIKNGRLGFSSHHGIHGNLVKDVVIQDLIISDYEVAAIAINGADGLTIKRVICEGGRTDKPTLGIYSSSRFLRRYVNYLKDINYNGTINIGNDEMNIHDIYSNLRDTINNVFNDVITTQNGERGGFINKHTHPNEYALFHNDAGILDGNAYGILLNKPGFAVNGFPTIPSDPFTNVHISNVEIHNTISQIREVIVIVGDEEKPITDPIGAAVQMFNRHPDTNEYITISSEDLSQAEYIGNAVSNAQFFVAKAILAGAFSESSISTVHSAINQELIDWVEATSGSQTAKLQNYIDNFGLYCNGDAMFHADKGVIGLKLDASQNVVVENTLISGVTNNGKLGSTLCNYNTFEKSNPNSEQTGYQGAVTRGISVCGSVGIDLIDVIIEDVSANSGSAVGIDTMLGSYDVNIIDCSISDVHASTGHNSIHDYTGPNAYPEAIGIRAGSNTADVIIDNLSGSAKDFSNANNGHIAFIQNDSVGGDIIYSSTSYTDDDNDFSDTSSSNTLFVPLSILFLTLFF